MGMDNHGFRLRNRHLRCRCEPKIIATARKDWAKGVGNPARRYKNMGEPEAKPKRPGPRWMGDPTKLSPTGWVTWLNYEKIESGWVTQANKKTRRKYGGKKQPKKPDQTGETYQAVGKEDLRIPQG